MRCERPARSCETGQVFSARGLTSASIAMIAKVRDCENLAVAVCHHRRRDFGSLGRAARHYEARKSETSPEPLDCIYIFLFLSPSQSLSQDRSAEIT